MPKQQYSIKGMHCAACEVLIENAFAKVPGVQKVNASTQRGCAVVEYEGAEPKLHDLNRAIQKHGYAVERGADGEGSAEGPGFWKSVFIIAGVLLGAWLLFRSGLSSSFSVSASTSLPAFFLFGLLAGFSTCAALVGGIVLAMSKQWLRLYGQNASTWERLEPHWQFNLGRLLSYTVLGGLLGGLGGWFRPSADLTTALTLLVSAVMILLALQMLGVPGLKGFQIRLPKFLTRRMADETAFQGKQMPWLMGALTFFLPCGFTLTAQSLALLSGSFFQGALIMGFFALGTLPVLFGIGVASVKLTEQRRWSALFSTAAGALVLLFALLNINAQFTILGWPGLPSFSSQPAEAQEGLAPLVDGKQILRMTVSSQGYTPERFRVRVNVPVRWEISGEGGGCANAITARNFFPETIYLTPGQEEAKEFTPTKVGNFRFTCTMGMFSGVIEVVES